MCVCVAMQCVAIGTTVRHRYACKAHHIQMHLQWDFSVRRTDGCIAMGRLGGISFERPNLERELSRERSVKNSDGRMKIRAFGGFVDIRHLAVNVENANRLATDRESIHLFTMN